MMDKDMLRKQFLICVKMLQSISDEERVDRDTTCGRLSPSGVKLYNNLARIFNGLFVDNQLLLFDEDETPNSVLFPKPQELLACVEIALLFLTANDGQA